MKIWFYTLLISFFVSNSLIAKTLEQKKIDLKKAFEAGAITKTEFKRAEDFLENSGKKEQKEKSKYFNSNKEKDKKKKFSKQTFKKRG